MGQSGIVIWKNSLEWNAGDRDLGSLRSLRDPLSATEKFSEMLDSPGPKGGKSQITMIVHPSSC